MLVDSWNVLTVKLSQKKLQNKTINLPSYIISTHIVIPQISFFIHFVEPSTCIDREGLAFFLCLYIKLKLENNKSIKREYRHLGIIQQLISFMKSSLKIMWNHSSHTCEGGGTHLRISCWHLLMNLKNI